MPRTSRMVISNENASYHVIVRTALDGFPLADEEKNYLLELLKRLSSFYFVEIFGFCLMGDHFHLLVETFPQKCYSDVEVKKRFKKFYGDGRSVAKDRMPYLREKLSSLAAFMGEIKVGFSRYYNRRHNRRGYFWGDRFKSVIMEKGRTLVSCLAYIDLNPVRAGMVERPEQYRWNSLGYHIQTNNRDRFLSTDFGFKELNGGSKKERIEKYRHYVHEAGAIIRLGKIPAEMIEEKHLAKEGMSDAEINRIKRFRCRTRYFSDSGIIGSKEFISEHYKQFKHLFQSKHEKKPKPIKGLEGIYSLKRLSEVI